MKKQVTRGRTYYNNFSSIETRTQDAANGGSYFKGTTRIIWGWAKDEIRKLFVEFGSGRSSCQPCGPPRCGFASAADPQAALLPRRWMGVGGGFRRTFGARTRTRTPALLRDAQRRTVEQIRIHH